MYIYIYMYLYIHVYMYTYYYIIHNDKFHIGGMTSHVWEDIQFIKSLQMH
jgi:hypothetical protein